jgi:hypothetical protein
LCGCLTYLWLQEALSIYSNLLIQVDLLVLVLPCISLKIFLLLDHPTSRSDHLASDPLLSFPGILSDSIHPAPL